MLGEMVGEEEGEEQAGGEEGTAGGGSCRFERERLQEKKEFRGMQ